MKKQTLVITIIISLLLNLFFLGRYWIERSKTPSKIYVTEYDLSAPNLETTTWKIGEAEFYKTESRISRDWEGHVIFNFEFTSKDKLLPPN